METPINPAANFGVEIGLVSILFVLLVARFWVLRHTERRRADWIRDILYVLALFSCVGITTCLAYYCWKMISAYERAAIYVDHQMAEAARNSTQEAEQSQAEVQQKRAVLIEGAVTVEMLSSWYRRVRELATQRISFS